MKHSRLSLAVGLNIRGLKSLTFQLPAGTPLQAPEPLPEPEIADVRPDPEPSRGPKAKSPLVGGNRQQRRAMIAAARRKAR